MTPSSAASCELGMDEVHEKKPRRNSLSDNKPRRNSLSDLDIFDEETSVGQRVADTVTDSLGSWTFLLSNILFLILWIICNQELEASFDPYPFILMNVLLSAQAAYTAPVILMSQNRHLEKQRLRDSDLHEKVDHVRLNQIDAIFHELRYQRRHMLQILGKMRLGPETNDEEDEAAGMTDGEERFEHKHRARKKVIPAAVQRKTCLWGLVNLGRDERNFTFSERMADRVARAMGCWAFIIGQTVVVITWIVVNSTTDGWDHYPFILMNLMFSIQAAFTAPIILMSQNRQGYVDQIRNEDLHEKIDHVRLNRIMLVWDELREQRGEMDKLLKHLDIKTKPRELPSDEMFINGVLSATSTDSSDVDADHEGTAENKRSAPLSPRPPRRRSSFTEKDRAGATVQMTDVNRGYVVRWHPDEENDLV